MKCTTNESGLYVIPNDYELENQGYSGPGYYWSHYNNDGSDKSVIYMLVVDSKNSSIIERLYKIQPLKNNIEPTIIPKESQRVLIKGDVLLIQNAPTAATSIVSYEKYVYCQIADNKFMLINFRTGNRFSNTIYNSGTKIKDLINYKIHNYKYSHNLSDLNEMNRNQTLRDILYNL